MWPASCHIGDVLPNILSFAEPRLSKVTLSDWNWEGAGGYYQIRAGLMTVCKEWGHCINRIPLSLVRFRRKDQGGGFKYDDLKIAAFCARDSSVIASLALKLYDNEANDAYVKTFAKCQYIKRLSIKCLALLSTPELFLQDKIRLSHLNSLQCPVYILLNVELQKPCDITVHGLCGVGVNICTEFMQWISQQGCHIRQLSLAHYQSSDPQKFAASVTVEQFLISWARHLQEIRHLDLDVLLDIAHPPDTSSVCGLSLHPPSLDSLAFIQTHLPNLKSLTLSRRKFQPSQIIQLAEQVKRQPEGIRKRWYCNFLLNLRFFSDGKKKSMPFFCLPWPHPNKMSTELLAWVVACAAENPFACPNGIFGYNRRAFDESSQDMSTCVKLLAFFPLSQEAWAHLLISPTCSPNLWQFECAARQLVLDNATSACERLKGYPSFLCERWGTRKTWKYFKQHPNSPIQEHFWRNQACNMLCVLLKKSDKGNEAAARKFQFIVRLAWERHALWTVLLCPRKEGRLQPKTIYSLIDKFPENISKRWLIGAPPEAFFVGLSLTQVIGQAEEQESQFAASYFEQNPTIINSEIYTFKSAFNADSSLIKRKSALIYLQRAIFCSNTPPNSIQRSFMGQWFQLLMKDLGPGGAERRAFIKNCHCWFSYWSSAVPSKSVADVM
jgi:hypothetical protein